MMLLAPYLFISLSLADVQGNLFSATQPLASHEMPLNDRQPDSWVNQVFRDNILLSLAYMEGKVRKGDSIDWKKVGSPNHYEFVLNPNQVFAFHDQLLPSYEGKVSQTTNAHFNFTEGFKSDGYLTGDGVCHLASLFNWVAQDAKLEAEAPTSHDFALVPDIPQRFGVSIYDQPNFWEVGARQNLYITNNHHKPVKFILDYKDDKVRLAIEEINSI